MDKLYIFTAILITVLIVVIIFELKSMHPFNKIVYLNSNSTKALQNGYLNPSDLGYPEILNQRSKLLSFEDHIKKIVGASNDAKVIINSGATESIANIMFWTKKLNRYGCVVGSKFDHGCVRDNANLYELQYSQNIRKLPENTACVFMTQVNGSTGEIFNIENYRKNILGNYIRPKGIGNTLWTDENECNDIVPLQFRPLLVIDASQSINKVPIKMKEWEVDAVFFSLHKLGGPEGIGIMVVDNNSFVPLIAGKQQQHLRGGTLPLESVLDYAEIFDDVDDYNQRIDTWNHAHEYLSKAGLKVYTPKNKHLYNTLLVEVNECPLGIISELADEGIYIGNVSSCENEDIFNKEETKGGTKNNTTQEGPKAVNEGPKAIRISFENDTKIDNSTLDKIIGHLLAS